MNIAKMRFAIDDPRMAAFVDRLEDINARADAAPGFVWRLQTEDGDATGIDFFGPDLLVNMSVWRDVEALREFAFRSPHRELLAARAQWFEPMSEAWAVLWWIPAGPLPTLEEAADRLDSLRAHGPNAAAFTFGHLFEPG